jgi:hypothetical protein
MMYSFAVACVHSAFMLILRLFVICSCSFYLYISGKKPIEFHRAVISSFPPFIHFLYTSFVRLSSFKHRVYIGVVRVLQFRTQCCRLRKYMELHVAMETA